jgi:pyrophosphate--fructose-6-phosphate 1-phosphotransferase
MAGKNYGVYLIPEGLIDEVPETKALINILSKTRKNIEKEGIGTKADRDKEPIEIKRKYMAMKPKQRLNYVKEILSESDNKADKAAYNTLEKLPDSTQVKLIMAKPDAHGNIPVSQIDTENVIIHLVEKNIKEINSTIDRKNRNLKKGEKATPKISFAPQGHFLGYEGRCEFPSNFDTNYCYALGYNAVALINAGATGYMSTISNLTKPPKDWKAGGVPITSMMNKEFRNGKDKPVIKKALVDLNGPVFKEFAKQRDKWILGNGKDEYYDYPGPIQYFGPDEVCNAPTKTLKLEQGAA